ncbi:roadblock/LC7 domain-containing protein [Streptomyces sp. NBC_00286]|uniref:roadblock/LC7 domain-containing protein n=1 Tax=Streptomyces sp. NBC_00286 TaxID=2975701 RepID=UPI002E2BFFAB|nr:roadblock/LC7 domain-containing protein [Streptomyces sp. NBC_00286]
MAAEAEVLDELHRLRARVPQLTGALAASVDGLVIAQDTPGVEPEGLAALTAAALGVAVRLADATGRGDLRELLVRGTHGYVATYSAGSSAVLTLLAQDRVNVGRLHLEGRRAATRIGELADAATARATPPPRTAGATAVGKAQSRAPSPTTDKSALPTRPTKPPRARTPRTTQTAQAASRAAQTAGSAQANGRSTSRTTGRTTTNTPTTNES